MNCFPTRMLPRLARCATALIAVLCAAPVAEGAAPPRYDLGTFEGVAAQWWVVQELKESFRAGWSFENTSDRPVEFTYSIVFECSGTPTRMALQGAKLKAHERKAGQWEGMSSYPCKATAPTSARIEDFKLGGAGKSTCDPAKVQIQVRLTPAGEIQVLQIVRDNERFTLSRQSILEYKSAKSDGPTLLLRSSAESEPVAIDVSRLVQEFCGPRASVPVGVVEALTHKLAGALQSVIKESCDKDPEPAKCQERTRTHTRVSFGVRD